MDNIVNTVIIDYLHVQTNKGKSQQTLITVKSVLYTAYENKCDNL